MKVLQLIPDLRVGGAERVAVMLANGLRQTGNESVLAMIHGKNQQLVSSLQLDSHSHLACFGIRRRSVLRPFGFAHDIRRLLDLICDLIREHQPDFVVTHLVEEGFLARACVKKTGIGAYVPFIQNSVFHLNHPPRAIRTMIRNPLVRANLRAAHRILAMSDAVQESVQDLVQLPPGQVCVLRNGVDLQPYAKLSDRNEAREELSLPPDCPVIMGLGRLVPQKNFSALILASQRVLKDHPDAIFIVFGEGPERQLLEGLIQKKGLEESWRLPGVHLQPALCLAAADVFCQPSRHEGFSIAIAEAMASKLPVVTTNFLGVEEQVTHGENGMCVAVEDSDALAETILHLLDDQDFARSLGESARAAAFAEFGEITFLNRFQELLAP